MRKKNKKSNFWEFLIYKIFKLDFLPEFFIYVAIVVAYAAFQLYLGKKETSKSIVNIVIILVLLTSVVAIIAPYFFKFLFNDKDKKNEDLTTFLLRKEYSDQQLKINETIKETLNKNPEILNVEKTIYDKILSNLEATLINKLDERFKNNIKGDFISNSIISELNPLTRNVEKYIDRIQRNSAVNLLIGIIGTIAAITILAYTISTDKTFDSLQNFLIHFLPRFTFVIFIQLFAFFFLRLYKNNLEDAKYFQNELTNLTAKSASIKIAYLMGNTDKVYDNLKELSTVERNFKLLKDETTIGLEKARMETEMDKSILEQIKDLLSKFETKK